MFSAEDVQTRLRVRPFVPVRIVTTTGEMYDIRHPDMVLVTRRFLDIGMPAPDNATIADQVARVAIIHVTEMRDLAVTPPLTNGPAS